MFDSINDLTAKLAATGYFIDPVMTQVVFLAAKLQKPLLLEGPAGSGKTQLAVSVAAAGCIEAPQNVYARFSISTTSRSAPDFKRSK